MLSNLRVIGLAAALSLVPAAAAEAHGPESDARTPMEALSALHQHNGADGHLPAVQRNVQLVGKLDLFQGGERPGRISDVAAFGEHAYLGAFYEPDCEEGGVYVIDIADPASPKQAGFIPTSPGAYVGEGVQVLDLDTSAFEGQVLIHNNENCLPVAGPLPVGRGGASLWNVTDPTQPKALAQHVGDMDVVLPGTTHASAPHASHSAFGWQQGDRAYMVMVDNGELGRTDIDIFDITDPAKPALVVETGLNDFPEAQETPSPNGNNSFIHDMIVKRVGDRYLMLASYWDGGYVVLDVTDLPAKPRFVGDTDFGATEPYRAEMALPEDWTPEGNAHQAEFSPDSTRFLAADEDFGAFRVDASITSGPHAGERFSATQGSNVPQIDEDTTLDGPTVFVGQACGAVPPAPSPNAVAVAERGTCTFTIKLQSVRAAGYAGGIVFNDKATDPDCDAHVYMLAVGDIPFVFVGRTAGLQLLGLTFEDACATNTPVAAEGAGVRLAGRFDGWGYLHLYDTQTMQALDHWALPESLDREKAQGYGDLSIHEVAMDPQRNLAYSSHYSGGLRVFDFADGTIREVGAYISEGGNNLWGVEVHRLAGDASTYPLVLTSDRDSGLWIFRYSPTTTTRPRGGRPPDRGRRAEAIRRANARSGG
jgi:hypothetical protein